MAPSAMPERPPFIDAHVHFWTLGGRIRYPWLSPPFSDDGPNGSVAAIARDYGPDDYRTDAAHWDIRGIVHVEAGASPEDALAETDWLGELADDCAAPDAIVAFAALDAPDIESLLAAHAARPRVRGIRHIVNWHRDARRSYTPRDVTGDAAWAAGFALLKKYGFSFDLQAYPGQFAGLARLFARHPQTPVIVNHLGMMPGEDERDAWRRGMTALAALPQVAVKLSGVGFAYRPWDLDQARRYVLDTIDIFGAERAMVASDFPTDRLFGTFDRHLDAYLAIVGGFAESEQRALFAGNANRIYRLGITL